ncbi:hypothetical protein [Microbacterium sp. KR10-403]|uniref:hypothetical protein n=1 Tax=Microbacterium sp. KR10-403 TaxID=3158581 RepID=UPI0032E496D3
MTVPIGGGVGIATTDGGRMTPVDYFGDALQAGLEEAWNHFHPELEEQLRQLLTTPDLIASGFTLYDTRVSIAKDLSYAIDRDDTDDVVITVTTGQNRIETHTTQPTVLGKWADPAISVTFGLSFTYVLDIPSITGPLSASRFSHVRVLAPVVKPENVIADFAFLLNDVLRFMSGVDLIAVAERTVAGFDFAGVANRALVPLNTELGRLADEGYWFMDVLVDALDGTSGTLHAQSFPGFSGAPADQLGVVLTVRALDRSGVIEGEVHWPAEIGAPALPLAQRLGDLSQLTSAALSGALGQVAPAPAATGPATHVTPEGLSPAEQAAVPRLTSAVQAPVPADPIQKGLLGLDAQDRITAAAELRRGSASRFFAVLGTSLAAAQIDQIARGRSDFVIEVTTELREKADSPEERVLFGETRVVGRMSGLWAADDEKTMRRRFRLVDVATDVPLTVTVRVAKGYSWHGPTEYVSPAKDGWDGEVTVHRMQEKNAHRVLGDLSDLRTHGALSAPVGIGVAIGAVDGQESALNPQPLPPKALNPQPLPPKASPFVPRLGKKKAHGGLTVDIGAAAKLDVPPVVSERVGGVRDDVVRLVKRDDPSGEGVVRGIDFVMTPYTPSRLG